MRHVYIEIATGRICVDHPIYKAYVLEFENTAEVIQEEDMNSLDERLEYLGEL